MSKYGLSAGQCFAWKSTGGDFVREGVQSLREGECPLCVRFCRGGGGRCCLYGSLAAVAAVAATGMGVSFEVEEFRDR